MHKADTSRQQPLSLSPRDGCCRTTRGNTDRMKIVIILCTLQIAVVAGLLFKLDQLETKVSDLALRQASINATRLGGIPPQDSTSATPQPDMQAVASLLRGIVKEELDFALITLSKPQTPRLATTAPALARVEEQADPEYQYQLEVMSAEIDNYVSRGSISDAEMADLHMQLARLDDNDRKQMMRKLVRAMNSGGLKGRL